MVNYTSANTQLLQYDIPNLDPYELVEVSVSASNSAGEGPRTTGVRGRTREERKLSKVSYCTVQVHRYVGACVSILLYISVHDILYYTAYVDSCISYYGCSQCMKYSYTYTEIDI